MDVNDNGVPRRRTRIEREIYREPSGMYAVCFMLSGKPRFRTVSRDLEAARYEREALVVAAQMGAVSALPRLRFDTVDLPGGTIHVRAQLSRAHHGAPARRVPPKTTASVRETPLVAQLAAVLREHRRASEFTAGDDWVFGTSRGTPLGHRNAERRALHRAALDRPAEQRRVAATSLPRPPPYLC